MRFPNIPVPSDRSLRWMKWVVVAAVLTAVIGLVIAFTQISSRLDDSTDDLKALADYNALQDATISAQQLALDRANDRLRDAGRAPVAVPDAPEPVQGERGPVGPAGESIVGPRGPAGRDGQSIVGPRGPRGFAGSDSTIPGPPGDAGAASTVPGPKGDPGPPGKDGKDGTDATPEMVDAAVSRYCSVRGECVGPQGPAGQQGPQGGPGVVRVVTDDSCLGPPIVKVALAYDAATQTLTLVCA